MELYLQSPIYLHDMHKDNFAFTFTFTCTSTFASREHVTWEKYVENVGTFGTCVLQSLTRYLVYVLSTTEGKVGLTETSKIQVDLRYSHSWHEIPSYVTSAVDKQCTSAF